MKELNLLLFFSILTLLSASHQWFNEDLNLISASEFESKIA